MRTVPNETPASLFERPSQTFALDPRAIDWILADEANPLNRLVHLIPSGSRVLDIGAGNGILARLLHQIHGDHVVIDGIEPDAAAADAARAHYRKLFEEPVHTFLAQDRNCGSYDFIVLADVIEHFPNPQQVLQALRAQLHASARICVSTPNVAFVAVRIALLNGAFDYVDSGILERTHLRFFTLRTLQQLFTATGLFPETTMLLKRNPLTTEIRLHDYKVSPSALSTVLKDELSSVYQFLFVLGSGTGSGVVERYGDPGHSVIFEYVKRRLAARFARSRRQ
jgi:2-polyprenyl-3-methyl-5-hydroxy-6-metoxy-1,4-benzoquinol methylase